MKLLNEEEIQRLLEENLHFPAELSSDHEKENLEQYRFLFEQLKEEPKEGLPFSFAANVKKRLQARLNRKKDLRFYLVAFVALTVSFLLFYGLLQTINESAADQFLVVVLKFKWAIVLGTLVFLSILYLDQKFVKERMA
ncbi:hypothetical protein H9X96_06275 [Pedobacter sp. N36a]|uniref:hypothetical protein n=1 Tax=Pedobacter sp. N36a TaxID=2767996 RepID=UPI001656E613|nr:hypothetical protein [Pedobacter sp. N36a]MBC8985376.1 hypothetical protein [Pedobacter sp. N36a]